MDREADRTFGKKSHLTVVLPVSDSRMADRDCPTLIAITSVTTI